MAEWEKAIKAEAKWIRTRARVVTIRNEALAGARAEHPGGNNLPPEEPVSEHDKLRRMLLEMMGWK